MKFTRRSFLSTSLGLAAGAMASGLPRSRAQAAGAPPLRLIIFPSMNGSAFFWPDGGNVSALSPVTASLAPYKSQVQFIRGVGIAGSYNHFAVRSMFTGFPIADYLGPDPNVPSVDQVIAGQIAATAATPMRSLHLGAIPAAAYEYYQLYGRSTFFFKNTPVDYEANPVTAFDTIFGGGPKPAPTAPAPGAAGPSPNTLHDAALAIVQAELGDLEMRTAQLPREQAKLAAHRQAIAPLVRGNMTTPAAPMAGPVDKTALPSVEALRPNLQGNPRAAYESKYYSQLIDAQVDILARAVVSGLTRVATLQCNSADGDTTVPVDGGVPHHLTSHGDPAQFARVQAWYAGKFLRLLQALDVPDPLSNDGKTVLYNSAIVWMSECQPGHGSDEVPLMIAGSAGGRLKTGGLVTAAGASNKNLLRTLCRVFGVADSDAAHFGAQPISEVLV